VDTAKLDYLVDMVGEMVIAQSLVRHNGTLAATADPILTATWRGWPASPAKCERRVTAIRWRADGS
jgi:two-component system chemotaxis sensor kinase CheA